MLIQGGIERENATISMAKKVKPKEIDPYADMMPIRIVPPVFFPGHTSHTRVEKKVFSDEAKYRQEVRPNMYERMELEVKHSKLKAKMDRARAKREAMKKKFQEDMNKMKDEAAALEKEEKEEEEMKKAEEEEAKDAKNGKKKKWGEKSVKEKNEEKKKKEESEKKKKEEDEDEPQGVSTAAENGEAEASDSDSDGEGLSSVEKAAMAEVALQIKEKKIVKARNSKLAYIPKSQSSVTWLARKVYYGFGERDHGMTQITPWLYIGGQEFSAGLQHLMKMGISHVLNVTAEVANHYPQYFVYQRIPLKDSTDADSLIKYPTAAKFLKRVWDARGKVLVHCSQGVSRAPTMVIAYLVQVQGIALSDAYDFVVSLRPRVNINRKFLLDLSRWELQHHGHSSVMYHKDWQFYEYNMMKGDAIEHAEPVGAFETCKYLWSHLKDEEDFLAMV